MRDYHCVMASKIKSTAARVLSTGEATDEEARSLAAYALGDAEPMRTAHTRDDLDRIQGTSLDKGVEMDALKALPEPERKELIDRAAANWHSRSKPGRLEPTPVIPQQRAPIWKHCWEIVGLSGRG